MTLALKVTPASAAPSPPLETILALRDQEASSSVIAPRLTQAREWLRQQQAVLDDAKSRATASLEISDAELAEASEAAAIAERAVDRLAAMALLLQADLNAATARETVEALQTSHAALAEPLAALQRWQDETYPEICRAIARGLDAQDRVDACNAAWKVKVQAAYQQQGVRDLGPLGLQAQDLGGVLPRQAFPAWQLVESS